jgi:hypothetical protein
MENGKREAAMQPPTQPIKKRARLIGLARTMQENVINHVG